MKLDTTVFTDLLKRHKIRMEAKPLMFPGLVMDKRFAATNQKTPNALKYATTKQLLFKGQNMMWARVRFVLDLDRIAPKQNEVANVTVKLRRRPGIHTVAQAPITDLMAANPAERDRLEIHPGWDIQTSGLDRAQSEESTDPEKQAAL